MTTRTINAVARDIAADWRKPYFGAVPYLRAMQSLESVQSRYGMDSGESIVRYFLANAGQWRGDKARAVKAELRAMLAGGGHE